MSDQKHPGERAKLIDTSKLKPWKQNPRRIDQARLNNLKASMQQDPDFLRLRPILAQGDGTVYAGNQRLKAAKELGLEQVWAVLEDVDETTMKARALRDNNQWGEWEPGELSAMLDEIPSDLHDLLGFDDLKSLKAEQLEVVEDEAPEPPKEPKSKLGDLYQLGEHRLLCGDATKIEDVERLMDGQKADMVFTDPPYGVSFQSNMRTKSEKFDILENDDTILTDWIAPVATSSQGWVFVWTTWKVLDKWLPVIDQFGKMSNMIVWHKGRGREVQGKRIGSVWALNKDFAGKYQHPTQKPVALASEAIQKTSQQGERVLDVFGGSGSTLIACEQINRKCYMMELDPRYVDVIVKRWETFTGKTATLVPHA